MAAYNSYVVEYEHGSTWYTLSNVQSLDCSVGRVLPTDDWPVSTATIRVWYPEGFDTPIANLRINTKIRFFCPGRSSTKPTWTGYVSDLRVDIGIPWNNSTKDGNADFLVIECEGALAKVGRSQTRNAETTQGLVKAMLWTYISLNDPSQNVAPVVASSYADEIQTSFCSYKTVSGTSISIMALVQAFAKTWQLRLVDGIRKDWSGAGTADPRSIGDSDDPAFYVSTARLVASEIASVSFSDTANDATRRIYNDIQFESLMDTLYNSAAMDDFTGNSYIANAGTELGSQFTGYVVEDIYIPGQELLPNTQDGVNYWANAFSNPQISLTSISATTSGQHTQNLDTLGFTDLELGYLLTKGVNVTLRGQNYLCRIEGVRLTADLNESRFTYYLSDADVTGWFILDSADLGVLNTNNLGSY